MTNHLIMLVAAALLATTGACALRPATPTVTTDRDGTIREINACSGLGCVPTTPDQDARQEGAPVTVIPVVLRGSF